MRVSPRRVPRFAVPTRGNGRSVDHTHARVARGEPADVGDRIVARAAVDDEDLADLGAAREQPLHARADAAGSSRTGTITLIAPAGRSTRDGGDGRRAHARRPSG